VATYRVAVTYTVDVVDEEALLQAGAAAWEASAGGWAVRVDEDGGVVEATNEEAAAIAPGQRPASPWSSAPSHTPPPGVWFAASSVDVQPGTPE
jgi:hypothetical protein